MFDRPAGSAPGGTPKPAEWLWPLADGAVASRHFADLSDLDRALAARCRALAARPDLIRRYTRFHWWPR